jgi:hypothetical protein
MKIPFIRRALRPDIVNLSCESGAHAARKCSIHMPRQRLAEQNHLNLAYLAGNSHGPKKAMRKLKQPKLSRYASLLLKNPACRQQPAAGV